MNKILIAFLLTFISLIGFSQTPKETEMIKYVNLVRTNPKAFKDSVIAYKNTINGALSESKAQKLKAYGFHVTESNPNFNQIKDSIYNKNINDINELIACLDTVKSINELNFNYRVYLSLKSHKGITKTGIVHDEVIDRINKFIKTDYAGENVINGETDPMLAVIKLMIDSDVPGKGHRRNILDTKFNSIAVRYVDGVGFIQDFIK